MKQNYLALLLTFTVALSGMAADPDSVQADNSAKNARDRSGQTMTSGDQSNSSNDVKITDTIRKAVVADKSLSMMEKNVKIITVGGKVTLRGPVHTPKAKDLIANIAKQAGGSVTIDNQLEVKAP